MLERDPYFDHFVQALGGDDNALEPDLKDPTHIARARVYRNNSITASGEAIFKDYPAVEKLVGTDFLRAAASAFVKENPPENPLLSLYGEGFADFLDTFPPAKDLPYLSDVARLDRAWMNTMFAANSAPLGPQDIAGLDDSEIGALAPGLHPSVQILKSEWPAWDIWHANREEGAPQSINLERKNSVAIMWWSANGVSSQKLNSQECVFLENVREGDDLTSAMSKAVSSEADSNALFGFFSLALSSGIFGKSANTEANPKGHQA